MKRLSIFALALAGSIFATTALAQVLNPSFEDTPEFAGWTVVDPSDFTMVGSIDTLAHTGTSYALLGASPTFGTLSQSFSTNPGDLFSVSFWLASDRTSAVSNSFEVLWNGGSVLSLTDVPAPGNINPYQNFTINLPAATGATSLLEFRYVNNDDFFRLDDVSLSVVPEASTLSFAFLGLGVLAGWQYRNSKRRTVG